MTVTQTFNLDAGPSPRSMLHALWTVLLVLTLGACLALATPGCSTADYRAFKDTMRPVVATTCGLCRTICPPAEAILGSGGEEPVAEDE